MSLIYYINKLVSSKYMEKIPGFWRIRRLIRDYYHSSTRYYKVPYLGHEIFICPAHSMGKKIFNDGVYEPAIINAIQIFVQHGYSFVDIGANVGLHTLAAAFARSSEDQFFDSFEPELQLFSRLRKNCHVNGMDFVKCIQEAVGDANTYLPLYISSTNNKGLNSLFQIENTTSGQKVKVNTLDSLYLNNISASKKILIKIDTEGYELPIIRGGTQLFSMLSNLAIICEVSPSIMAKNKLNIDDLFSTLNKCGVCDYEIFNDEETISDLGNDNDQIMILFHKGEMTKKIASLLSGIKRQ